jgi:CRISPR-associated protein (TIGR02710 family)
MVLKLFLATVGKEREPHIFANCIQQDLESLYNCDQFEDDIQLLIYFLCSKKSEESAECAKKAIFANHKLNTNTEINKEVINDEDVDNLDILIKRTQKMLEEISKHEWVRSSTIPCQAILNPTFGTKSMSLALTIACLTDENLNRENLKIHLTNNRDGANQPINEVDVEVLNTPFLYQQAKTLMRQNRFKAVKTLCNEIQKRKGWGKKAEALTKLSQFYLDWDLFNFKTSIQCLENMSSTKTILQQAEGCLPNLDGIKTTLEELNSVNQKNPKILFAVNLLINADRRAKEGRYDDALARLYRLFEYLTQISLLKINIDDTKIDINVIQRLRSEELKSSLGNEIKLSGKNEIEIGLMKKLHILYDQGQPIGNLYNDNELKILLSNRNKSLLAHGYTPIGEKIFKQLREKLGTVLREFFFESEQEFFEMSQKVSFPWETAESE